MAKRKRGFTDAKYEKCLKEGKVQGLVKNINLQDIPSDGEATRLLPLTLICCK